jgi:hypothetical protein
MNLYRALEDTHLIVATNIELLSSLWVSICSYYTHLTAISHHKVCSQWMRDRSPRRIDIIYERASGLNWKRLCDYATLFCIEYHYPESDEHHSGAHWRQLELVRCSGCVTLIQR